jgi:hypothetical protein
MAESPSAPRRRHIPALWLVVGGPALVVVASFATLFVAVRGGDRPLVDTAAAQSTATTPATQARNHAAGAGR